MLLSEATMSQQKKEDLIQTEIRGKQITQIMTGEKGDTIVGTQQGVNK